MPGARKESIVGKRRDTRKSIQAEDGGFAPPPPPPMPGEDFALPVKEIVKPENQLQLTETQLEEEIAKMLTANNPTAPKNIARFNQKERCFKFEPMVEQTMCHFATQGWLLFNESEEAKKQIDSQKLEHEAMLKFQQELERAQEKKEEGTETEAPDDSKQLRNQFNFTERAAQTFNLPIRERDTVTEPPPTALFSGRCTQFDIYDEYIKDQTRQKQSEEAAKAKAAAKKGGGVAPSPKNEDEDDNKQKEKDDVFGSEPMQKGVKVMERMVNQNLFDDVTMDFKYWDDTSDVYYPAKASMLPLWKFEYKEAGRHVTAVSWNPKYQDLFAIGFGSFEFLKQSNGMIAVFSLKNTSHPEFTYKTDSGVMSIDWHPTFPNLILAGCYDGSLVVYDVHETEVEGIYQTSQSSGKHSDPVWGVKWTIDELQTVLQFYSLSSDGQCALWSLAKAELVKEDVMKLRPPRHIAEQQQAAGQIIQLQGGCSMDFNQAQSHLYLIGTEDGYIHKCSKAYSSEYLQTYIGHTMNIYSVKWNCIHTRMFLSASADWTVKLWDSNKARPIMTFDLHNPVGDVAWAPYSATVFAAVTDDGKVHVFDIAVNKLGPLCEQQVVKKSVKLTRIAFNPKHPIILIGDDRGCVTSLKLSPNLRKVSEVQSGQKFEDLEIAKLDKVLEVALKSQPEFEE
eukprot:TRINITY_DN22470_c0_g1_i5.p1 TRINITY_DN22470_c0_g1~~TRINITY_DN22470_c0_g1_i5.p1  ORF type:complete len:678 (-),score=142.08 TRINITY_DN22470_c0_g1_i5:229-2262(-)